MKKHAILSIVGVILLSAAFILPVMAEDDSPRAVYSRYNAAQRAGNLEDMCKYVSDGKVQQLQSLSDDQKKDLAQTMKTMAPTEYTVVNEEIYRNHATLTLSGKFADFPGGSRDQQGKARFIREGGAWKLEKEFWK